MKSLALLLALSIACAVGAAGGFGEFAGPLNFTLSPGHEQSLQWGILNTFTHPLNVSLVVESAPGGFVNVSVSPNQVLLNESTILLANVTVRAPQNILGAWSGSLIATAAPSVNETGAVQISLSTIKRFSVDVEQCPSFQLVSPFAGIVGAPCTVVANPAQLQAAGLYYGKLMVTVA